MKATATIIRRNGDEVEVDNVESVRDLNLLLAVSDADFEIMQGNDDEKFVVVYDANAPSSRANKRASEMVPSLAKELGGRICGDVVIMDHEQFERLQR